MKKPTYITAMVDFKINDLAGVKKVISEWCIAEKASQGTLMYEFYFSEDNTHGTVIETFADDDGQQAHMINIEKFGPSFTMYAEFTNFLYLGDVSDVVKERLKDYPFIYMPFHDGFRRLP
tara:strand:- start:112 stop:471 length:360 start_codon:yes stop_codon:yes gene_type:complete